MALRSVLTSSLPQTEPCLGLRLLEQMSLALNVDLTLQLQLTILGRSCMCTQYLKRNSNLQTRHVSHEHKVEPDKYPAQLSFARLFLSELLK